MTRERALELADECITGMVVRHTPAPASHIADAILAALAEEKATCRKSAYAEADEEQVLQIGHETIESLAGAAKIGRSISVKRPARI